MVQIKNNQATAILLLACEDQKGLVAAVSDFIFRHQGNIVHADQHIDADEHVFLQRVEWELKDFTIPRKQIAKHFKPLAKKFGMNWELKFSDDRPRLAILVSKQAHCLVDLLSRQRLGELKATIPFVIASEPDLKSVAKDFGIPFYYQPFDQDTRAEAERAMIKRFEQEQIDLIVLARYMKILSADLVNRYEHKIINIHHSFLPAFVGNRPYHQAYERGVKIIGATAHYVTPELDAGPIIEQDVVRVSHRDSVEDLISRGRDLEKIVLARALVWQLNNRILIHNNKTVVFD